MNAIEELELAIEEANDLINYAFDEPHVAIPERRARLWRELGTAAVNAREREVWTVRLEIAIERLLEDHNAHKEGDK